jgi:3-oxoacyl-[acyl-carrier-protein] synthase III
VRTEGVYVRSLGAFLPETVSVSSAVDEGLLDAHDAEVYGLTGIAIAGELPAPDMALSAVRQALDRCGQDPAALDLLLYASVWHQGPSGWCPQYYIQRHAGAGNATAAEVRQGCMGMFSALELAARWLMGSPDGGSALVTSADNFNSPQIDRWRFSPHYIMADAGCAAVLSTEPGFARVCSIGSVTLAEYETLHRPPEPLFPPGAGLGRPMNFANTKAQWLDSGARSSGGPLALVRAQDELVADTLSEAGIDLDEVALVAYVHGSRDRVEGRAMIPLGIPLSRSMWEFSRTVGHIGASDQIVSLDHYVTEGKLGPGDHVLMLGVGPGLNIACAVIEILERPAWAN